MSVNKVSEQFIYLSVYIFDEYINLNVNVKRLVIRLTLSYLVFCHSSSPFISFSHL